MPSLIEKYFSDTDRDAIVVATKDAERRTSGELVCYIVERCDAYPAATLRAMFAGGVLAAMGAAFWREHYGGWGSPDHVWVVLALGCGALVGWLLSRLDAVERWLVGPDVLDRRASARAAEAFVEEQVFATRERTGVLIFLGLFEHRVIVLADEGIDARVDDGAWRTVTDHIAAGIRAGAPAAALVQGVEECAAILEQHGVAGREDDNNELSDEPRFRQS